MKLLCNRLLKKASKLRFRGITNENDENNSDKSKNIQQSAGPNSEIPLYVEDKYTLSTKGWFWPYLSGPGAERLLRECADGSFLVRNSSTAGFFFTVTYKVQGKVGSLRVECKDGLFCLLFSDANQPREPTLQRLILRLLDKSQEGCICELKRDREGRPEAIPFKLEKPLLRHISLKDHCRSAIMRNIRDPEQVRQLQLPLEVKDFLLEMTDNSRLDR